MESHPYYQNKKTFESQWETPPDWVDPGPAKNRLEVASTALQRLLAQEKKDLQFLRTCREAVRNAFILDPAPSSPAELSSSVNSVEDRHSEDHDLQQQDAEFKSMDSEMREVLDTDTKWDVYPAEGRLEEERKKDTGEEEDMEPAADSEDRWEETSRGTFKTGTVETTEEVDKQHADDLNPAEQHEPRTWGLTRPPPPPPRRKTPRSSKRPPSRPLRR